MLQASLIERAQRGIRGSADDIGWLQRDPQMPPVKDGTQRFNEILSDVRNGVNKLPNSMVYLLVPGLCSNYSPLSFTNTRTHLMKMGLSCQIAKIDSVASVETNARVLKCQIEGIYRSERKPVMLLGHSKGGLDAAAALSMYWSDLKGKVAGLVTGQSPYGGTPVASGLLDQGQVGDFLIKMILVLICKIIKGDLQALQDLTYKERRKFLKKYDLPKEVPVVSFRTEANTQAAAATLTRVENAVLLTGRQEVTVSLDAALNAIAFLIYAIYGEKSDGLVTCCDAEVPGSVVVRPKRLMNHTWLTSPPVNGNSSEANSAEMCEALLQLLMEIGQKSKFI